MTVIEIARVEEWRSQNRVRGAMVRALQQWLDSHELPAIIAAVFGVIIALSVLIVVGGYLVMTL